MIHQFSHSFSCLFTVVSAKNKPNIIVVCVKCNAVCTLLCTNTSQKHLKVSRNIQLLDLTVIVHHPFNNNNKL